LIKQPSFIVVVSSVESEIHQFQYFDIQVSCDIPKGLSFLEYTSTPNAVYDAGIRRKIDKPNIIVKIEARKFHFLVIL
jgi:hypothetical protein